MSQWSTLLLEHHLKELEAAQLPAGIRQAGRPVCRRGRRPSPVLAPVGRTGIIDRHQRMVERRIRAADSRRSRAWTASTSRPSLREQGLGDGAGPL